jgi:hypothetical protein
MRQVDARVELKQIRKGSKARIRIEIVGTKLEFVDEDAQNAGWQIRVVLQAHGRSHASHLQARLDSRQKVGSARLFGGNFRIPRHAYGVAGDHAVPPIKGRQV